METIINSLSSNQQIINMSEYVNIQTIKKISKLFQRSKIFRQR